MGKEMPAAFYDAAYARLNKYRAHYSQSVYFKLWKNLISYIKPNDQIFEAACGTGQLAKMIYDKFQDKVKYIGVDFSVKAIQIAKEMCPEYPFIVRDVIKCPIMEMSNFNTLIACEFLEHINDDVPFLVSIWENKKNIKILTTVPDFKAHNHVRHFPTLEDVYRRYKPYIENLYVVKIGARYLMKGWINGIPRNKNGG